MFLADPDFRAIASELGASTEENRIILGSDIHVLLSVNGQNPGQILVWLPELGQYFKRDLYEEA